MATKSSKYEMFIFGLCSTADDWLSHLSDESRLKCEKMAAKSSKNEMFIFGVHSTSDDQPSNLTDKSCPKCKKMATKSKNEMQFMHPPPDEMGMGQEQYGDRLGMGQVWDGMIQVDFMQMA